MYQILEKEPSQQSHVYSQATSPNVLPPRQTARTGSALRSTRLAALESRLSLAIEKQSSIYCVPDREQSQESHVYPQATSPALLPSRQATSLMSRQRLAFEKLSRRMTLLSVSMDR